MARSTKRRKAKTKFRLTKELIFLLLFLVVIAISTGLMGIKSKKDVLLSKITTAQQAAGQSQNLLTEDNVYGEISYKKLVTKVKKSSYTYVYYGSYSDQSYLSNMETINQRAQKYDVKKVYLLDSSWATSLDTSDKTYGETNNETLTQVEKALDDVDLKTMNQLWVFKDGKIVFNSKDLIEDKYQPAPWNFVIEQAFGTYNNK